jgi:hypothetical protein
VVTDHLAEGPCQCHCWFPGSSLGLDSLSRIKIMCGT